MVKKEIWPKQQRESARTPISGQSAPLYYKMGRTVGESVRERTINRVHVDLLHLLRGGSWNLQARGREGA